MCIGRLTVVGSFSFPGGGRRRPRDQARGLQPRVRSDGVRLNSRKLVGFHWTIGYGKLLTFDPRASRSRAVRRVGGRRTSGRWTSSGPGHSTGTSSTARAGVDVTDPRTGRRSTATVRNQTFAVAFPVYETPTSESPSVVARSLTQTVGIRGVDADRCRWYWVGRTRFTRTGRYAVSAADRHFA